MGGRHCFKTNSKEGNILYSEDKAINAETEKVKNGMKGRNNVRKVSKVWTLYKTQFLFISILMKHPYEDFFHLKHLGTRGRRKESKTVQETEPNKRQ